MASRLLSRSRSTLFDTSSTTADDPSSSAQHLPSSSSGLASEKASSTLKSRDDADEQHSEYSNIFGTRPPKQRNPSYTSQTAPSSKNEKRRSKGASGFLNAFKSIATNANPRRSPQEPQKSFEVIRVKRKPAGTTPPANSTSSAFPPSPQPDSSPKPSISDPAKEATPATGPPSDTSAFSLVEHESGTLPPDSQASYFPPLRLVTSDSVPPAASPPFSAADEYSSSKDIDDVDEEATEQPHQSSSIDPSAPGSQIPATRSPRTVSTNKKHRSSFVSLTRRFSGLSGYDLAGARPAASPPTTPLTNLTGPHTSPSAAPTGSFTLRSMRNVTDGGNPGARASTLYQHNTTHDSSDAHNPPTVIDSPTHDFPEPITAPQSPLIALPDHATNPLSPHDPTAHPQSPLSSPAVSPSIQTKPFYAQPHGSSISVAKFKNPRVRSESGTFSPNTTFDQLARPSSSRPASPSVGVGLLQTPDGLRPSEQLAALEAELAIGGRVTPMIRQLEERFENSALRSHPSYTNDSSMQRPGGNAPLDCSRSVFATPPAVPGKDPWLLNRQRRQTSLDASLLLRGTSNDGSTFSPPTHDLAHLNRRLSDRFGTSDGTRPETKSGGLRLSSRDGATGIHPDVSPSQSSLPQLTNSNVRGSGRGWDSATFLSSFKGSGHTQPKTLLDALSQMEADRAHQGRGEQTAATSRNTAAASPSVAERLLAPFASARQTSTTLPPAAPLMSPENSPQDQLSVDSTVGGKEPRDSISQSSTTSTSQAADVLLALAATPEPILFLETEEENYFPAVTELPVRDVATTAESAFDHDTPRISTQSPDHSTLDANPGDAEGAALMDDPTKQSTEAPVEAYQTVRRPSLRTGSNGAAMNAHREHRYGIDPVTMDLWQKHTDAVYGIGQVPPMSPIGKHRKARSVSHASRPRSKKHATAGETDPPPVPDSPESTRYWLDQRPAVQNREPPSPGAAVPLVRASTMSSAARGAPTSTQAKQELASLPTVHATPVVHGLPQQHARAHPAQKLPESVPSGSAPLDVNTLLSIDLPLGIHPQVWSSLTVEAQAQIRAHYAQAVQAARMACQRAYESRMAPIWSQLSGPTQQTTLAPAASRTPTGNSPTGTSFAVTRQRTLSQPERKLSEGLVPMAIASQATQTDGPSVALYPRPPTRGPTPHQTDQTSRGATGGGPEWQAMHPEVHRQNTMRMPQQHQQQYHHHHQLLPAGSGPSRQSGQEQYRGPHYPVPPGHHYQAHAQARPRPMSQSSGRPPSGPVYYPQQQYRPYNDPRDQYGMRPQHMQPPPQHHPYWQHPQRTHERAPDVYSQMARQPSQEMNLRPSTHGMRPTMDQSGNAGSNRSNHPYQANHQATSHVSLHRPAPPPSRRPSVPNLRVATDDVDRGPSAKFMATPVVDTSSVPLPAFDAPPDASQAGALLTDEMKRLNQTRGVTPGEYSTTKRFID